MEYFVASFLKAIEAKEKQSAFIIELITSKKFIQELLQQANKLHPPFEKESTLSL